MGLGRSHWHPHATGMDLTQTWAGKPWVSLPALPGGQKRESWQGHRARYFPGACIQWRIVLPAGITSIPISHSSIFSDRCGLKIEQKRPQSSFGFILGSRVWPQTCFREPPCAHPLQAGGTADRTGMVTLRLRGLETPCQGSDRRGWLGRHGAAQGEQGGWTCMGCQGGDRETAWERGGWVGKGLLGEHRAAGWAWGGQTGTGQQAPTL